MMNEQKCKFNLTVFQESLKKKEEASSVIRICYHFSSELHLDYKNIHEYYNVYIGDRTCLDLSRLYVKIANASI